MIKAQKLNRLSRAARKDVLFMLRMAALAPKGVFEDEEDEVLMSFSEEAPYERHFDDYTRNYEEVA